MMRLLGCACCLKPRWLVCIARNAMDEDYPVDREWTAAGGVLRSVDVAFPVIVACVQAEVERRTGKRTGRFHKVDPPLNTFEWPVLRLRFVVDLPSQPMSVAEELAIG